jgi:hypothetical protein
MSVLQLAVGILKENGVRAGLQAGRIGFLLTLSAADEKYPVVSENPVKYRVEVVANNQGSAGRPVLSSGALSFFRRLVKPADQVHPVQSGCDPARMAKLVDAPGLGPDASNGVGVRVPLLAPRIY